MTLAPIALTLSVALAQLPLSTQVQLPTGETAELATDLLQYEPTRQLLVAKGNTVLKTPQALLRADEITFDQARNVATARGNVMFVSGMFAAVADAIEVDIDSFEATVEGGLFMQKKGVAPEVLLSARTPEELKNAGETTIAITGTGIKRLSPKEFVVEGLVFTPCDCDAKSPTWRVEASSAEVELGEKAILNWPVVYVYQVPVFALPWLYLPLSERRTGLLVPQPKFGGLNTFALNVPVFVTLGRSYDLTLTPGYYFGHTTFERDGKQEPFPFGIEGPRLKTEFRYVPSATTSGRATFGLVYDTRPQRNVLNAFAEPLPQQRGLRYEGSLQHTSNLGRGFYNRIDAAFLSDGYFLRDLSADIIASVEGYLRSTASLFHRADDTYVGLDAVLRQDLRGGYSLFGEDLDAEGNVIRGQGMIQRFPGILLAAPQKQLFGPIFGGIQFDFARLAPLVGETGDEGTDGIFIFDPALVDADGTQGNGVWDPGEREGRLRLDIRPQLSAELSLGRFGRVNPYASFRETIYWGEQSQRLLHRGYGVIGTAVETEISRTFGDGQGALRHLIVPSVDVRMVPAVFGSSALLENDTLRSIPYDAYDLAISSEGIFQGVAQISQRLLKRQGNAGREIVRLDLGQNVDIGRGSVGDTFARFSALAGAFSTSAIARYNFSEPVANRLTQVSANVRVDNAKGTFAYAAYDALIDGGSERLRAGIDELVGRPYEPNPLVDGQPSGTRTRAEQFSAGGRIQFGFGLGLSYEALLLKQLVDLDDNGTREAERFRPVHHVVGISYGPACDCWRAEVRAILRPTQEGTFIPEFGGNLTLARFGTLGT